MVASEVTLSGNHSQPLVARMLQQCNDIELNPGPKNHGSPMKKSTSSGNFMKLNGNANKNGNSDNGDSRDGLPANDPPRIKKLGKSGPTAIAFRSLVLLVSYFALNSIHESYVKIRFSEKICFDNVFSCHYKVKSYVRSIKSFLCFLIYTF